MSNIYDNWERLVRATLKREELRELARAPSFSDSDLSDSSPLHNDVPWKTSLKNSEQVNYFSASSSMSSKGRTFQILEHVRHQIHNSNHIDKLEEHQSGAYNMVFDEYGEELYFGLAKTMTLHLEKITSRIEAATGDSFLENLNAEWTDHNQALKRIRHRLMCMDKIFIPSAHQKSVHRLGLNLWRDNVIHKTKIQARLQRTLLELIIKDRTGEVVNRRLMKNTIQMLVSLGLSAYQQDFEKPFLEASTDFYRAESQKLIECNDCGDYLRKAERFLNEETKRVSQYLDAKSKAEITDIMWREIITNYKLRLLNMENSGLVKMILGDKHEDLRRLYSLFVRVPNGLSSIRDVMASHVRNTGKQHVTDPQKLKNPVDLVDSLLEERDKYDKIISFAFNNDETFQNALNSSFEYFINLNPDFPQYIALFVDDKLHKGFEGLKEDDIETFLGNVITLFRYLEEKHVFVKCYNQYLAKRLMSGRTVFDNAELSLIFKLKTELS